jgi:hypothetical protein
MPKTPEQLHAEQSALPPMRTYYVVMERPKGSYIWTEYFKSESADAANHAAKLRVTADPEVVRPTDCIVIHYSVPRMPHPETEPPYAVLADGDTTFVGVPR